MQKEQQTRILGQKQLFRGKWLAISEVQFAIGDRQPRGYEAIRRTTDTKGRPNGVDVIPIIKYKDRPSELVLIVEFRPPVKGLSLEFPTGMTESDNPEEDAKRELLEQTGYTAYQIVKEGREVLYSDPWKSNQTSTVVLALIDGDDPKCRPGQKLEQDQNIRVVRMRVDEKLVDRVVGYCEKHSLHLQAKVYSMCMGIWLRHNLNNLTQPPQ